MMTEVRYWGRKIILFKELVEMSKLIVTDLDNTLLNSDLQVSSYTRDVLAQCQDAGHKVVYATARAKRATRDFAWTSPFATSNDSRHQSRFNSNHELRPDYLVTNNGATVWTKDELLESVDIFAHDVEILVTRFLETPEVSLIMLEYGETCMTNLDRSLWEPDYETVRTDFSSFQGFDTPKITIECTSPLTADSLVGSLPRVQLYSNQGLSWYQIVRKDIDKARGVRMLVDRYGYRRSEDVICFGDDINDISMMNYCGTSIAVANALDSVKEHADSICANNDEDGVARWLEQNLL